MAARPDHIVLREYHAARRRGDDGVAAERWVELVVDNYDRLVQAVKLFRFSAASRGLPADEQGSAVSEAYLRVVAMGRDFKSTDVEAFYAALFRTAHNACRDYGRAEYRHQRRAGGSLDETYEPDGATGPYDGLLADRDAEQRDATRDAVEAERRRLRDEQLVQWGIGQIANESYRRVLELTFCDDPPPGGEVAAHLGITEENVYQRRRRGLKQLEEILRARQ